MPKKLSKKAQNAVNNKITSAPKKKTSNWDRIQELEKELSAIKYNKSTQHHYGLVRAKISELKKKEEARSAKGPKTTGYSVKKSGDATVILVGFPSSGKSSLLNAITNANSPVGAYEFTTLDVIPGLLEYKDAKIQILDVPGIVQGAASGRGRGREVLSVLQNADLALILVDTLRPNALNVIKKEIQDSHLRLNKIRPDVKVTKKSKNGIRIGKTVHCPKLADETIIAICKQMRVNNAEILIRTPIDADDFIDIVEKNKIYIPGITILNKMDLVDENRLSEIADEVDADLCISAQDKINLEAIKEAIFDKLDFIRIYCKESGKKADMGIPLIMKRNSTIHNMCDKLHRDFSKRFRFARVWGKSAKFPGQRLMLHHTIKDKDVVEIHLR
ncbi:GTP-binding protein [Candidatus Woesearchaeota archaeon]|nr:GTP-binding protein [Candidatus Woesearchaeota archaeon]